METNDEPLTQERFARVLYERYGVDRNGQTWGDATHGAQHEWFYEAGKVADLLGLPLSPGPQHACP